MVQSAAAKLFTQTVEPVAFLQQIDTQKTRPPETIAGLFLGDLKQGAMTTGLGVKRRHQPQKGTHLSLLSSSVDS